MRYLVVLLLAGCATPQGNTCIDSTHKVGDLIMNADRGKYGVITEIHGESSRCPFLKQSVLATVKYR